MNTRKYSILVLASLLLVTALLSPACAKSKMKVRYDEGMYNLELKDAKVADVLKVLFRGTGYKYEIRNGGEAKVSLEKKRLIFEAALKAVVDAAGLKLSNERDTYVISGQQPAVSGQQAAAGSQQPSEPVQKVEGSKETLPPPAKESPKTVPQGELGPLVRVGLTALGSPSSVVISSGSAFDIKGGNGIVRAPADQNITFSVKDGGIAVSGADTSIVCKGPVRLVSVDGGLFSIGTRRYKGVLEVGPGGKGLLVLNELPLENYIRGVVAMEVPQSFHPEAQKALLLAIRTYAYTTLGSKRHTAAGFDLCDTTHCQGFAGCVSGRDWIDKLVDGTRGELIFYVGKPIHATYSTDCGGVTQNNEDAGFGTDPWPYLRSVVDNNKGDSSLDCAEDYCSGCPSHTWKKEYTLDEVDKAVTKSGLAKVGKVTSIEFSDYDCSGRVKTVRIKGESGEATTTGSKLRTALGSAVLKSTRMKLTSASDGKFVIEGRGYGHGVGLCAFGANGMAKSGGAKYGEILKFYYTGVAIKKAY